MIKAVLLDFYGVIQTDEVDVWAEKYIAARPELQQVFDDISRRIDLDVINLDQYYAELASVGNISVDELKAQLAKEVIINHPLLGVADQLRAKGLQVAIVSNDGSSLRSYIERNGIAEHVDQIFVSGELGFMKPDIRIFEHVLQELNIKPQEAYFFDDRLANVDGAIRAGIHAELYKSVSQIRKLVS